jgi:hypothetical protein
MIIYKYRQAGLFLIVSFVFSSASAGFGDWLSGAKGFLDPASLSSPSSTLSSDKISRGLKQAQAVGVAKTTRQAGVTAYSKELLSKAGLITYCHQRQI